MTTILATRQHNVTTLAADRGWSSFDGRTYVQAPCVSKIVRMADWLAVAASGGGAIVGWLEAATPPATALVTSGPEAYVAVRKWWAHFLKTHRGHLDHEEFDGARVMFATPWWIASADTQGCIILQDEPNAVMAVGSGGDYALGAYDAALTCGVLHAQAIAWAIHIAAKYDHHTVAEFDVVVPTVPAVTS